MQLVPMSQKIIVQRDAAEERSRGGIVLPEVAKEKPVRGKVVAVGKGRLLEGGFREPLEVAVGEQILFLRYRGFEVTHEGQELLVLDPDDIIAVLR